MANRNRDKGNGYERQIAQELRELGFTDVVTSRYASKETDDAKVDLVFQNKSCPLNIQLKKTTNTPQYFKIRSESPFNNETFCLIWNKQVKKNKNFGSEGECVIVDKRLFYKLIKNQYIMAKKKANLCKVTFKQNDSKIELVFEEKDGKISYKADDSKFVEDSNENLLARSLSNFLLAQLIAFYRYQQSQEKQTTLTESF